MNRTILTAVISYSLVIPGERRQVRMDPDIEVNELSLMHMGRPYDRVIETICCPRFATSPGRKRE